MKTVMVTATTVAALLGAGHLVTAQEQNPPGKRWVGATQAGESSETAEDDDSAADDSADEYPAAAPQRAVAYGYDYAGHPGLYDPKGPVYGHPGGYAGYSAGEPFQAGSGTLAAGYDDDGVDEGTADGGHSCCGNGCCQTCCTPFWAHRSGVFAEALYLRPRGADVAYAEVRNGIDPATAVPFGRVATTSPNYSFGYRVGFARALDRCTSIVASYTYYQTETDGSLFANPPLSIHSLVTLPQTFTTASDSLAALGRENIRFQFLDVDYKRLLNGGNNWAVNYTVGTRYANLHEAFREAQPIGPGHTNVAANVNFDALGTRIGLQGERRAGNRGFLCYGKGFASLVVGTFNSGYLQTNNFQGAQGAAAWKDSRAVPILEYELGVGWQNRTGRIRLMAGYYFAAWFNTVSPNNFINAVQTNGYLNNTSSRSDTVTFDGFTTRAELLW